STPLTLRRPIKRCSRKKSHRFCLNNLLQFFPPRICRRQLLLQKLQTGLLRGDLDTTLLIELRLGHFLMERRNLGVILLDFSRQPIEFMSLFERCPPLGRQRFLAGPSRRGSSRIGLVGIATRRHFPLPLP